MTLFGKERSAKGSEATAAPLEERLPDEARLEPGRESSGSVPQGLNAYLGKGSSISGKLSFSGAVRVDGRVEGEINAQEMLFVGETAEINAQISGSAVVITGRVTGDVSARKRVEIRAPARVLGNISTPTLVIQEGVIFEGHCTMSAAEGERESKIARLPRDDKLRDKSLKQQNESGR